MVFRFFFFFKKKKEEKRKNKNSKGSYFISLAFLLLKTCFTYVFIHLEFGVLPFVKRWLLNQNMNFVVVDK